MWPAVIAAGMGVLQGMKKDKQNREAMKMQALENRYAPLFNQAPSSFRQLDTGQAGAGGLAGAVGGYQTSMNQRMMEEAMARNQNPYARQQPPAPMAQNFLGARQDPYA